MHGLSEVIAIAGGDTQSLAVRHDGSVWAWGFTAGETVTTAQRVSGLSNVAAIVSGSTHSMALKRDGTAWAWGRNQFGQIGDGTDEDRFAPVQVRGIADVAWVAVGFGTSYAVLADGTLWAWGLGTLPEPGKVDGLFGMTSVESQALADHVLALRDDGVLWAWGRNVEGQLGDGTTGGARETPGRVIGLDGVAVPEAGP